MSISSQNTGNMKELYVMMILVAGMVIAVTGAVSAQEPESSEKNIEPVTVFSWAASDPPDWKQGGFYLLLGAFGALVTVYSLIGAALPGTAGQVKIDIHTIHLENMSEQLKKLVDTSPHDTEAINAVGKVVNDLRDDLWKERWRQFGIAAMLYVFLGAFFSVLLAQDMLQALVIGAGWTGLTGTLGLKKDYEKRKSIKDAAMRKEIELLMEKEAVLPTDMEEAALVKKDLEEQIATLKRDVEIALKL